MRAFRSRFESGRSGVLSETSEQPATHTAAARIAGRRTLMKTMCVLTFLQAYTTTRCYVNASGHYVSAAIDRPGGHRRAVTLNLAALRGTAPMDVGSDCALRRRGISGGSGDA